MKDENYIPALRYDLLTPIYDPVVRLTTREAVFKRALIEQSNVAGVYRSRILDLACGTGTLTVAIKRAAPRAEVVGLDGDRRILKIADAKARKAGVDIRFDEGLSFDLPYGRTEADRFDRVFSSLFFHHLTRENKLRTVREARRVLRSDGELHVADWGLPANALMSIASRAIALLDGEETTADNFDGRLPELIADAGFGAIEETSRFNTVFGTIRLLRCRMSGGA